MTDTGVPVQHDYGHLTADGSIEVVRRLASAGLFVGGDTSDSCAAYCASRAD